MANRKQVTKQVYTDRKFHRIGDHKRHLQCRFCYSNEIETVINFGFVPLAGGFIKSGATQADFDRERLYPLRIAFCPKCGLLQVVDIVDTSVLYHDYFYFSSAIKTLADHFKQYAKELHETVKNPKGKLVVEIGCNDGVFLKPLKEEGFDVVGVDPAENVVKPLLKQGYDVLIDCFGEKSAQKVKEKHGQADFVVTSNSFAHIDDMHDVMRGVKLLLKKKGVLIIEVHYLGTLIKEVQYDMMYHDHMSYYSMFALSNFFKLYDMEIYDVLQTSIHAGSIRFYVQNRKYGTHAVTKRVRELKKEEQTLGLHDVRTYRKFFEYIEETKRTLLKTLKRLKKNGATVAGYGASGRATAIMSFCKLDDSHLSAVIDDAPAKQGAYTPGNHLKIVSSDLLSDKKKRPDYCLVFAWSFINEIRNKRQDYLKKGGKFIVPLPHVRIIK